MQRRELWACIWLAAALPAAAADVPRLRFVDDQGRPVEGPLEVCFQLERSTECREVAPGKGVVVPAGYRRLRVEGPDHGPHTLRRDEVADRPVAVPRKAFLTVAGPPGLALTLSLYDPADATFRSSVFRAAVPATGLLKIPAGAFIASLSAPSSAPDLARLTALPAGKARLKYQPRPGWSLVLRCRDGAGKAVAQARVVLRGAAGYGEPGPAQ